MMLFDTAFQLPCRFGRVRHWKCRERGKPIGMLFHHVRQNIVGFFANADGFLRRHHIRHWSGVTEHLHVDLLLTHKIKANGIDIGQLFAGKPHGIVGVSHAFRQLRHIRGIAVFRICFDDAPVRIMLFDRDDLHIRSHHASMLSMPIPQRPASFEAGRPAVSAPSPSAFP